MYTLVLSVKGREFFYITGNFVPCYIKSLRGMRTRAKQKFVAKATALGGRVPRAELFVSFIGNSNFYESKKKHMFIEHMLDKHVFRHEKKTVIRSENIKTFFSEIIIVKWVIFI